jgi:heme-degrading monooxygenase HmoA
MYIAMNRFKVLKGSEADFETVWKNRDSRLKDVPGFVEFKLLRGPEDAAQGHVLYASHTVWRSHDDFVAWTKSEHFRQAHQNAGQTRVAYDGPPQFEGFSVVEGA